MPAEDPEQRRPDISVPQQKLDAGESKADLDQGLTKTIHYFEQLRTAL